VRCEDFGYMLHLGKVVQAYLDVGRDDLPGHHSHQGPCQFPCWKDFLRYWCDELSLVFSSCDDGLFDGVLDGWELW
jgi:hypothetical protein